MSGSRTRAAARTPASRKPRAARKRRSGLCLTVGAEGFEPSSRTLRTCTFPDRPVLNWDNVHRLHPDSPVLHGHLWAKCGQVVATASWRPEIAGQY